MNWDCHTDEITMNDLPDDEGKKEKTEKDKQEKELFSQDGLEHALLQDPNLYLRHYYKNRQYSATLDIVLPPPEQRT